MRAWLLQQPGRSSDEIVVDQSLPTQQHLLILVDCPGGTAEPDPAQDQPTAHPAGRGTS